jgi:hypothetical protein
MLHTGCFTQKALIVLAAASMGLAATSVTTDFLANGKIAAEVGHAVVAGVILGSGAWPYNLNPGPTEVQARLLLGPADCDWQGQCYKARLADLGAAPFIGSPAEFANFMSDETEKWREVVKFAGIKPE